MYPAGSGGGVESGSGGGDGEESDWLVGGHNTGEEIGIVTEHDVDSRGWNGCRRQGT